VAAFSLIDLLFALGIAATLGAVAIPQTLTMVDDMRTTAAARSVAASLQRARMVAVVRNRSTAVRFSGAGAESEEAFFVDGNGNGVLSSDIRDGIDRPIGPSQRVADRFAGSGFGALRDLPAVDPGGTPPGDDPVRFGAGSLAVFTPLGTASSGSIYLLGRGGAQFAVRVFGETGKTRVLKFLPRTGRWVPVSGR
jgi:type II secretory pathway pseudopilin PulG